MANKPHSLQVLITAGAEDPHRAKQGLETALAAQALNATVHVFLTLRGAFWARLHTHNSCVIPGCEEIPALIRALIEGGATVACCASCASQFIGSCQPSSANLMEGVELRGLTSMVAESLTGTPSLTF